MIEKASKSAGESNIMLSLFEGLLVRMIVTVSALNLAIWYGIQKKPNKVGTVILLGTIVLLISLTIQIWFVVVVVRYKV
jgi:hypothetical protein